MNQSVNTALWAFTGRYVNAWQEQQASLPQTEAYLGLASPCIVQETQNVILWKPIQRAVFGDFSSIEKAIGFCLHDDIKCFYSGLYCADMKGMLNEEHLELIQVWNEEDWLRLQENILGHLMMQKRLKQDPTVFIASTPDDQDVICICNLTGKVLKERIGTDERHVLSPDLLCFLLKLTPVV